MRNWILQDIDFCTLGNIKSLTTWKKGNQQRQHLIAVTTIDVPFHQRSSAIEGTATDGAVVSVVSQAINFIIAAAN